MFTAADVSIIKTPVRAPRANAIAQRFIGSIRRELLDGILITNQQHATAVPREYECHYNTHRPHRALGQAAPQRPLPHHTTPEIHNVRRCDRLGGLIHEYQQVAWGVQSFWHPQAPVEPRSRRRPARRVGRSHQVVPWPCSIAGIARRALEA